MTENGKKDASDLGSFLVVARMKTAIVFKSERSMTTTTPLQELNDHQEFKLFRTSPSSILYLFQCPPDTSALLFQIPSLSAHSALILLPWEEGENDRKRDDEKNIRFFGFFSKIARI